MFINNYGYVPCQFISDDDSQPFCLRKVASSAVKRMEDLARKILSEGMLKDASEEDIRSIVQKISSSDTYNSHGAVIDYSEAKQLGLNTVFLDDKDELWRRVWLLHCCYEHDLALRNIDKIFEGEKNSLARRASA